MRGSLRPAARCEDRTSRTASLTRRIRAPGILEHFLAGNERSLYENALGKLRLDIAPELGPGVVHDRRRSPHESGGERGALPQVVMVGLRDGGAEAALQLRLQRDDLLALALEAPVTGKVKLDLDQADEAHAGSPAPALGELALHLTRLEHLEDVAFLDVLVPLERDSALVTLGDLADVVLEAAQGADPARADDGSAAHEPAAGAAADDPARDVRPGDRPDARGAEGLTDLGGADGGLHLLGREHALHRLTQLVDDVVDDVVGADLDALALGGGERIADGPDAEADDHAVGSGGEHDVGLVDAADAVVDDVDLDLLLGQLRDLVGERLERAGHVGLQNEVQLRQVALLGAGEDVLERDLHAGAASDGLGLEAIGALTRE